MVHTPPPDVVTAEAPAVLVKAPAALNTTVSPDPAVTPLDRVKAPVVEMFTAPLLVTPETLLTVPTVSVGADEATVTAPVEATSVEKLFELLFRV
jgi:hypothetical protein